MKMRTEKMNILKYSACLTVLVCGVFFGMHFYKNAERKPTVNPFSDIIEPLNAEVDGQGNTGEKGGNGNGNESNSDKDKSDEILSDNSGQTENTSDNNSNDDSKFVNTTGENVIEQTSSPVGNNNKNNNSISGRPVDTVGIHSEITPDKEQSDTAYFDTSIKNNSVVFEKNFAFEIVQLQKKLKLRSCEVQVNNKAVPQFNGKCTLSEGKNTIRVLCTYTTQDNKIQRAYKDYTIYCYCGEIGFSTNLSNAETNSNKLDFTAQAYYGKTEIPLSVRVNGKKLDEKNSYSVKLEEGSNTITLSAEYKGKSAEKSFTVTYISVKEFQLVTDLFDRTVDNADFYFSAHLEGNSDKAKLSVAVNGKSVKGENGTYHITLKNGENIFLLKAKDGKNTIEQSYTVTLIPKADKDTKPVISEINLSDEMTVKGSGFSLVLSAADYQNNRIYADRIQVYINGSLVENEWQNSSQTGYFLNLTGGANSLEIRVTDFEGRYEDYFYTINCSKAEDGEEIGRVQMQFDAATLGLGELCQTEELSFCEGESAVDSIIKFLENNGFSANIKGTEDTGYYLSRINKAGAFSGGEIPQELQNLLSSDGIGKTGQTSADSLGELDYTQGSGWIISVNGKVTPYGLSQTHFSDGDVVRLTFTLAYGRDIAGAENGYEIYW